MWVQGEPRQGSARGLSPVPTHIVLPSLCMPERSRKRPSDPNQLGKLIVDVATGNASDSDPDAGKDPAAVALGRKGGLKGGKARAAKLTPEQRSASARKAAAARWKNHTP
jgi:hypothetical protein